MFSTYGSPEVLKLTQVPTAEPGPGQILVRVRAASVNPIDLHLRSGRMVTIRPVDFPAILGQDVAGVVEGIGAGAAFSVGDEVFGSLHGGGYSQHVVLDQAFAKPHELPFETAAALVTVGETAYRALQHLDVSVGQTLLILGAGGAVGSLVLQLAVARGLTVIGTAGEHDVDRIRRLGGIPVIYGDGWANRVRSVAERPLDRVLDTVGAGLLAGAIALAGEPGRVLTIADLNFAAYGVRLTGPDRADRFPEALPLIAGMIVRGEVELPVGRTYPLAEAATAHAEVEAGRARGKVVLIP
jgi:NADPH:quinone reductase-like Zn-dependent oxidoreductase